jgi:pimeloyl-ACP methyl ester carboxylesterase
VDRPGPADRTSDRSLTPPSSPTRRRLVRRALVVAAAIVAGLALGVGFDVARTGGLEAWLAARGIHVEAVPSVAYTALGRQVEVASRSIYLDCRGAGAPTVVLESGFRSGAGGWGEVLDGIAGFTRVCAWDRPGLGRSEARGSHSAGEAADDLRLALRTAGESGPYVVVAHSLGGVYARLFAAGGQDPGAGPPAGDEVLGFVMLDTYEPDLGLDRDPSVPPDVRTLIRENLDGTGAMFERGEDLDWGRTLAELDAEGPVELPTIFLSVNPRHRYNEPDPQRLAAILAAWYAAIGARYPNGRLEIVEGAGHMIQFDRPDLVIERVHELVGTT